VEIGFEHRARNAPRKLGPVFVHNGDGCMFDIKAHAGRHGMDGDSEDIDDEGEEDRVRREAAYLARKTKNIGECERNSSLLLTQAENGAAHQEERENRKRIISGHSCARPRPLANVPTLID